MEPATFRSESAALTTAPRDPTQNQPSLSWQTWRIPEKLYKWYGDRVERGESCTRDRRNNISQTPSPPPKVPQSWEGQFCPPLPQKMPILFHLGNKRQFKLCLQSVSNHQNQLVEAEKLFKKFIFLPVSTVHTCDIDSMKPHKCDLCGKMERYLLAGQAHRQLTFRRTQSFGARLGCSKRQATFLSLAFLSNRTCKYFLKEFFRKKNWTFFSLGWHVLRDFRLDVLQQHVLRNGSLL